MPPLKKKTAPKRNPRQKAKASQLEVYLVELRRRLAADRGIFARDHILGLMNWLMVDRNYRAVLEFCRG